MTKLTATISVLFLLLAPPAWAQNACPAEPDRFQALRSFLGAWQGEGQGQPGKSKVTREYTLVLDGRFIEVRNRSLYAPQEENPGEDHRDVGYISFDSARGKHVLRQFHVEGFVNQYVHESTSEDGKTLTFVTEAIENIPPGWRAREIYTLPGPDELMERFELAEPGKDFELYSETRLRRVKPGR
jgi:THAP4-like, heme-binding beta-barrel domain